MQRLKGKLNSRQIVSYSQIYNDDVGRHNVIKKKNRTEVKLIIILDVPRTFTRMTINVMGLSLTM